MSRRKGPICREKLVLLYFCMLLLAGSYAPEPNPGPRGQPQSDQSTLPSSTYTNNLLTSSSLASSREQLYIGTVYQPKWMRLPHWHDWRGRSPPNTSNGGFPSARVSRCGLLSSAGGDSSLVAPHKPVRSIYWARWDITAMFSFLFFSLLSLCHIRDRFYFLSFLLLLFIIFLLAHRNILVKFDRIT